jgi:poly(3-hydroxybutyrate) depolymerase
VPAALLTWNYVDTDGWTDDVAFVADVLDDVEATTCIDPDRVLATGFAVGGVFASIVTCELPDRIAVLATVSGLYDPEGCAPDAAKPVVSFHGTGDRFIPFDGGIGSGPANLGLSAETTAGLTFMLDRPGALDSSTAWAERDGCEAKPVEKPARGWGRAGRHPAGLAGVRGRPGRRAVRDRRRRTQLARQRRHGRLRGAARARVDRDRRHGR